MSNITTTKSEIFQAIVDICASGRVATRALVAERTGKKFSVVDDHVKTLRDEGVLRQVVPGVVEPVIVFPANRPVSKTVLADGTIKIELGDDVLTMTPGEARVVGLALYGDAMEFAHIKTEREVYDTVHSLRGELRSVSRDLANALKNIARLEQERRQDDLFTKGTLQ